MLSMNEKNAANNVLSLIALHISLLNCVELKPFNHFPLLNQQKLSEIDIDGQEFD
jgi:hypothetical protein